MPTRRRNRRRSSWEAWVTSSPFQIKDLPAGRHTIGVTLQHADHSSAGASAKVEVNVTNGGSGGGGSDGGGSGGGGIYDY